MGNKTLPKSWMRTKLKEIADIVLGQSPPSSTYNKDGKGLPFYQGKTDFGETYPTPQYWCSRPKKIAKKGDILISVRAPVGPTNICPDESCIGRGLAAIRPLGGMESRFILDLVRAFTDDLVVKSTGTTFNAITGDHLKDFSVVLPPLPEQHRIVAKIEELFSRLDVGVVALNRIKAELKRYRQAVLKSAFEGRLTKPELPNRWLGAKIADVSAKMQYGTSVKAEGDVSGIPVVRMGNIQDGKLIFEGLKYYPNDWPEKDDYLLHNGDVLFNRTNSAELVGKTAVYKSHYPPSVFASYLIRVKVDESKYNPDFLSHYINSSRGREYISSVVSQQVGQANVNGSKLAAMPIPFPPVDVQNRIAREIDRLFSEADEIDKTVDTALQQAQRLCQSILKRAFEGKLVLQDPKDEPASVLLERIKALKRGDKR